MMRSLCIVALIMMMQIYAESRTVSKFKYKKFAVRSEFAANVVEDNNSNGGGSGGSSEPVRKCNELPAPILNDILGAAFNSRYMSVDEPVFADDHNDDNPSLKRDAQNFKPFYVDDTYVMELSDKPAWEVSHLTGSDAEVAGEAGAEPATSTNATERIKRANNRRRNEDASQPQQQQTSSQQNKSKRPWECEAKIKWIDLGYDYYPRYLRTVECTRHACFYGHFTCKPRSFTVKLLRRRRGECVPSRHNIGVENLHDDLRELWVWEERAVNFCCDCAR